MNLEEPTNSELNRQIQALATLVKEGFDGVHRRQDVTNGRIGKVEDRVTKTEISIIKYDTSLSIFKWLFGALGLGNIVMIGKIISDLLSK